MIRRSARLSFSIVFIFLLIVLLINCQFYETAIAAQEPSDFHKNILILNSYNEGLTWTIDQNNGIIDEIHQDYNESSIYIDNLDWKNFPYEENLSFLKEYLKYKYSEKDIDVIIATDDAAFKFALENRKLLFSNAPVVFSGVNFESLKQLSGNYTNFTGIIEDVNPVETIKMALSINPTIKEIYLIYDNTESGLSTGKILQERISDEFKHMNIIPLNDLSFEQIKTTVSHLDESSIVLMSTYYRDAYGKVTEFESSIREISKASAVPLYHIYDFGIYNGAFGGDMVVGKNMGENAAKLAIRILNGENANEIPVSLKKISMKMVDFHQLERFGISMDKVPKNVTIANRPFSFLETYKNFVVVVSLIFFLMIVFVIVLFIYIRRIKRMEKEISDRNEELTQIYEEQVATDEELKNKLDQVNAIQKSLKLSEEKYTYLALHDVLTGLPNRRSLYEDAKSILNNGEDNVTALLFIDMDNFKYINDTMGHEFGDKLIKKVSERLSLSLGINSTIYRIGGDEFIILLWGVTVKADVEKYTNRILKISKEEFEIQSSALHISFSIGIAMYPEHGETIEELTKCADIAMYKAKERGRNRYVIYNTNMNKAFSERMNIEKYLHAAMERGEFEVYYQPQLDLSNNRITGLEALLRWKSPELGLVSPFKFIKVAEDTHLIIPLGEWVLIQACSFLKQMHINGLTGLTMSVNISILQLLQADFVDSVKKILDSFQMAPSKLELEITETVLIESFETVNKKLHLLRENGIRIALDDFGKGYSSLSYLRQLPISTLKIDKCFIDDVTKDQESGTITQHIIKLGRSMGLSVIAEGVEMHDQMESLREFECDKIQGYLFSKPLPKNEAERILLL